MKACPWSLGQRVELIDHPEVSGVVVRLRRRAHTRGLIPDSLAFNMDVRLDSPTLYVETLDRAWPADLEAPKILESISGCWQPFRIDKRTESVLASPSMTNEHASKLGKLGKGVPKTMSPAAKEQRQKAGKASGIARRARARKKKRLGSKRC